MYSVRSHSLSTQSEEAKDQFDVQFPAAWVLLLFVGILKFNLSFLPIVMLALVFNLTNTVGYTYGKFLFIIFVSLRKAETDQT